MDDFNQSRMCGLWGDLEDALLHQDTLRGGRGSIVAGPVLADDDPPYRDGTVRLLRAYSKVIAYVMGDDETAELRTRVVLLDQNLDGLRPATPLDEFRVRPVPLADVAARTRLAFAPVLHAGDDHTSRSRGIVAAEPRFIDAADQLHW
ncbi:endonuclease G [Nocardioides sp. J9]|nr:endonuclease G [Nocardioides sp. J9]